MARDNTPYVGICSRCQRPHTVRWSWTFEAWLCEFCAVITRRTTWGTWGTYAGPTHPSRAPHPVARG